MKNKIAGAGLAASLCALLLSAPVANSTPLRSSGAACTNSEYEIGKCLPFAAIPGEKFESTALKQALQRGERAQAEKFAATRPASISAADAVQLRTLAANAESTPLNDPENAGVGTIENRFSWSLHTPVIFGYCNPSGCQVVDVLNVNYSFNMYTMDAHVIFRGELATRDGARFDIKNHDCTLYADLNWAPDPNLQDIPQCDVAYNTSRYTVLEGNATNMRAGEWNYFAIGLRFKPIGSDREFVFNWESRRWFANVGGLQEFKQFRG